MPSNVIRQTTLSLRKEQCLADFCVTVIRLTKMKTKGPKYLKMLLQILSSVVGMVKQKGNKKGSIGSYLAILQGAWIERYLYASCIIVAVPIRRLYKNIV